MPDLPRRIRMDQWERPEKSIHAAMQDVESFGAHPLLTDAVILLSEAQRKVAAFIDRDGEW